MTDTQEFQADQTFWDTVEKEASAVESFSARASFGQITIVPNRYIKWTDGQPSDVSPEEFITLPSKNSSLELKFKVNVQEFRPEIDWEYNRDVRIGGADWWRTVRPSIEDAMGKGSMSKGNYNKTLQRLDGSYVEIHDVPKQKEPDYNTIKLVKVFANRDACFAEWQGRYGEGSAAPADANVPNGWETALWEEQVPAIKARLVNNEEASVIATSFGVDVAFIEALK